MPQASPGASSVSSAVHCAAVPYAVDIVSLSKQFRRHPLKRPGYSTLKSSLFSIFRPRPADSHIITHAVRDLTMRIPQGASMGIIGKNGSGKSTLLKLITGIYKPDRGTVSLNGRVAALIELGAGFHPDFSGRENLYLGGVMHGLTKAEVEERFDEIVRFAELESVIDDPIRTYSSGMFMRLGFSLAVHTDPDILLVDEVLAVGDAAFVAKCKLKIAELHKKGKTFLLVTHDLDAVERWCNEVIWLHEGVAKDRGDPRRVIDHYRQFVEKGEESELFEERQREETESAAGAPSAVASDTASAGLEKQDVPEQKKRWGSREVEISGVRLLDASSEARLLFHPEDKLTLEISYKINEKVDEAVFGIGINRSDGLVVHGSNTDIEKVEFPRLAGGGKIVYEIERLGLLDGHYTLDVAVHRKDGYPYDYHKEVLTFAVRSPFSQIGVYVPKHRWQMIGNG